MALTKKNLIDKVAEKTGTSKKIAKDIVDALFDEIINTVSEGESIQIAGFGKFDRSLRKARKGVNPSNHKAMDIPERNVPTFHAGKAFKEKCNQ